MEQNKTGKYFKYAIGEIVLVVIGILIALSINNWNENRKQNITDLSFLETLKTELSIDITTLSERILDYKSYNLGLEQVLELFNSKTKITNEEYQIIADAFRRIEVLTPVNQNSSRSNLNITNGTLLRIDKELHQGYLNYIELTNSRNDITSKLGESLQSISIQHISPLFDLTTELSTSNTKRLYYDFNYKTISENRLIRNAIAKSLYYRIVYVGWAENQKELAMNLLEDINDYLMAKN